MRTVLVEVILEQSWLRRSPPPRAASTLAAEGGRWIRIHKQIPRQFFHLFRAPRCLCGAEVSKRQPERRRDKTCLKNVTINSPEAATISNVHRQISRYQLAGQRKYEAHTVESSADIPCDRIDTRSRRRRFLHRDTSLSSTRCPWVHRTGRGCVRTFWSLDSTLRILLHPTQLLT